MTQLSINQSLTDTQTLDLIVAEVQAIPGSTDYTTDPVIDVILPQYWAMFSDKDSINPGLRLLFTKRALLDYLLGSVRRKLAVQIGQDKVDTLSLVTNLQSMRDNCERELNIQRSAPVSFRPKSTLPSAYRDAVKRGDMVQINSGDASQSVSGGAGNYET